MKNAAIIAAIVVVAAAAAAPYAMGLQTERETSADLNEFLGRVPWVTVTKHTYQRGWLSSEEEITFQPVAGLVPAVASGAAAVPPIQLTLHNTIHHGPLPGLAGFGLASIETRVVTPPGISAEYASAIAALPPVRTELNLFGGGRMVLKDAKRAALAAEGGWRLNSDGAEFAFTFGRHFDTFDVDASVPHLAASQTDGASMELTGFLLKNRSHRVLRSLYADNVDGTLGQLEFSAPMPNGAPRLDVGIDAFQYHSDTSMVSEYMNGVVVLSARSSHFAATKLEGVKLDLAFEHWQADALEQFAAGMRAGNKNPNAAPGEKAAQMMQLMKTAGVALVIHDPVLKINDAGFAMGEGFAKMSGSVRITGATASDFAAPIQIQAVLAKITAEFDIVIDDALADRLAQPKPPEGGAPSNAPPAANPLQALIDQGFVTRAGGKTRTKLDYRNGVFTVNGKPFSAAALQPPPPMPPPVVGKRPRPHPGA